jgi:hypothetical protein
MAIETNKKPGLQGAGCFFYLFENQCFKTDSRTQMNRNNDTNPNNAREHLPRQEQRRY